MSEKNDIVCHHLKSDNREQHDLSEAVLEKGTQSLQIQPLCCRCEWLTGLYMMCSNAVFHHQKTVTKNDCLFCFFSTLNNVALFLCRCHAICHCYPDWLEDSMPSSVVPCHSLCDCIASFLALVYARGEPNWRLATVFQFTALLVWLDLLIMLL